jgi:hypothetical protein
MQQSDPSDPEKQLKLWHAPQCTRKSWQTPQFIAIPFGDTRGGIVVSATDNASGTLPTAS